MLNGFGSTPIAKIGTWVYLLQENIRKKHTLKVTGRLFVPDIIQCLASPQNIAQKCAQTHTVKTVLLTGAHGATFNFGVLGENNLNMKHN